MPQVIVTGQEFLTKILAGERDFSGIKLEERTILSVCPQFDQVVKYLREHPDKSSPIILSGAKLKYLQADERLNLSYVVAENTDFEGACLPNADLSYANLQGACFADAVLTDADFRCANLQGAKLSAAYLVEADLSEANLSRASLDHAILVGANLGEASLQEADISGASLVGADLNEANLRKANLTSADLRAAENLDSVLNLTEAFFNRLVVTSKEKAYIEAVLSITPRYVLK